MRPRATSRPIGLRTLGEVAAAAVIYWSAGRLALLMAIPPGYATAVWPAAGLALVCVLVWGARVAPGIALGSFFVNVATSFDSSTADAIARSIAVAGGIGMGAALQATFGAHLIRRQIGFPTALEDERHIVLFVALGGPVSCVVSSVIGVSTLAIAGVVDSSSFIFNTFTWWAGDTIGVLVFAPLALLVVRSAHPVWRRRRWIVGLPLAVGFCIVTAMFIRASTWERGRLRTEFERRATPIASVLQSQLSKYEEIASGLASLFDASQEVTREEFHDFCERAVNAHTGLLALSWNPVVSQAERGSYEAIAHAEGLAGFSFLERGRDGGFVPAAIRPEYVPIFFIEPMVRNIKALGFDTSSDTTRHDVLERARKVGHHLAASSRIELVQGDRSGSNTGVLLVESVNERSSSRPHEVRGFVIAAFRTDDMVETALREVDHDGVTVRLFETNSSVSLYGSEADGRSDVVLGARVFTVSFGDRSWRLELAPTAAYLAGQQSWQAWLVLGGGLLFVGLLGVVLMMTTGRASRLEGLTAAVAASEASYRALYEDSPDMYLTVEIKEQIRIIDCNQTLCDQLGYTKAELVGRPFHVVYHPDYRGRAEERTVEFKATGEFADVERTLRTKAGGSIDASLYLRAVRDPRGAIIGARAVWRDITKRKQIERDQQFLVRLGEILAASPHVEEVLEAVTAELGRYLLVPRCAFAEIDGQNDRVTIHRDYHDGVPSVSGTLELSQFGPDTAAEARLGKMIVIEDASIDPRTQASYAGSYQLIGTRSAVAVPLLREGVWVVCFVVGSDQPRVWEDRETTLVKLVAERIWSWVEHLRILAELRATDVAAAVRHSEDRLRTLVQGMKEYAIFMLDPDGNVASWNDGAARLMGYTAPEVLGQNLELFHTPEDRAARTPIEILAKTREVGRFAEEGWRVQKDGTRFWADVTITTMFDRENQLEGYAKVTRDFTQRRAQEQTLRQSLKEREVLLQEVHHRVKNNLQVISSLINMQVRRLEPGVARDVLDECRSRVLAIALIHEKLYQSKDYSQVRFADYVRSLAADVFHAGVPSKRDVTLELDIDEVPLGVDLAIPCGLVMNELISNALKHGLRDRTRGIVRVAMKRVDQDTLRLTVSDDGTGLPAGFDIERLTSMGLQLVCTLAKQLEADLVVRGDGGATFQLTFRG